MLEKNAPKGKSDLHMLKNNHKHSYVVVVWCGVCLQDSKVEIANVNGKKSWSWRNVLLYDCLIRLKCNAAPLRERHKLRISFPPEHVKIIKSSV
jgi:hypothetical protein